MNIILFGAQGSGKGTQAQFLAEELGLKPCASGELLREAMALGTKAGQDARPYYERGDLVPDEIVVSMILEQVQDPGAHKGIILDGFPRTIAQARALDAGLLKLEQVIDCAIYLEVPREQLLDRLAGRYICRAHGHVWNLKTRPPRLPGVCDLDGSALFQRSDDTPEKIAHRLDIFFGETIHLTDFYAAQGKLLRIDGTASPETVNQVILDGVKDLADATTPDARQRAT